MMHGTLNSPDNPLDAGPGIGSMITVVIGFVEPTHPVPAAICMKLVECYNSEISSICVLTVIES